MSFTGHWKLDHELSQSKKDLMRAMGRPDWQINLVDTADEDFCLLHFCRHLPKGDLHYFDKRVEIYINHGVINFLSAVVPFMEFDRVRYSHELMANGKIVHHEDDEKRFGPCESVTTWDNDEQSFAIRWYIRKGILRVNHRVDGDLLRVNMKFTDKDSGAETLADKVYKRVPWSKEEKKYKDGHAEHLHLC